jgi:hypothetical protein
MISTNSEFKNRSLLKRPIRDFISPGRAIKKTEMGVIGSHIEGSTQHIV